MTVLWHVSAGTTGGSSGVLVEPVVQCSLALTHTTPAAFHGARQDSSANYRRSDHKSSMLSGDTESGAESGAAIDRLRACDLAHPTNQIIAFQQTVMVVVSNECLGYLLEPKPTLNCFVFSSVGGILLDVVPFTPQPKTSGASRQTRGNTTGRGQMVQRQRVSGTFSTTAGYFRHHIHL